MNNSLEIFLIMERKLYQLGGKREYNQHGHDCLNHPGEGYGKVLAVVPSLMILGILVVICHLNLEQFKLSADQG